MLESFLPGLLANIGRGAAYYVAVALAFFALWLWLRYRPGSRRALQDKPVSGVQLGREMLFSIATIVVGGSVLPVLFLFGFGRHTQFYPNAAQYGWAYFGLSIVLMMLVQDTWFYWTHRLMHHPRLFRLLHRTHHKSTNVNPWTTYSISPLGAVIDTIPIVLILLSIPASGLALFVFSWINTIYAVYTHLGYELYPRGMANHWLGRWINTSVAHNTHHARNRYNFGWYFLFWDRMMGTLDPGYAARFNAARTT